MTGAANLFRALLEFVFVLLGALLVLLAVSGQYIPDRHSLSWRVLATVVLIWGLRGLWRPDRRLGRWQSGMAGGSLMVVGGLMLAIIWAPFAWVRPLLAAAGAVLALRGLVGALPLKRAT